MRFWSCWRRPKECGHPHTVKVDSLEGEIVSYYCPDCEQTFYPVSSEEEAEIGVWTQETGWLHYG